MKILIVIVTEWSDLSSTHYSAGSVYLPAFVPFSSDGVVRVMTVDQFTEQYPGISLLGIGETTYWETKAKS